MNREIQSAEIFLKTFMMLIKSLKMISVKDAEFKLVEYYKMKS